jgi:hypothetical protein
MPQDSSRTHITRKVRYTCVYVYMISHQPALYTISRATLRASISYHDTRDSVDTQRHLRPHTTVGSFRDSSYHGPRGSRYDDTVTERTYRTLSLTPPDPHYVDMPCRAVRRRVSVWLVSRLDLVYSCHV